LTASSTDTPHGYESYQLDRAYNLKAYSLIPVAHHVRRWPGAKSAAWRVMHPTDRRRWRCGGRNADGTGVFAGLAGSQTDYEPDFGYSASWFVQVI
jgi:hypothetical protein